MSSDEGESFDLDVSASGSEDEFTPVKATKQVASKSKAAEKVAPKAKSTNTKTKAPVKKKVLEAHNDHADDSDMEVDDGFPSLAAEPPAPKQKKTASETYQKLSQLEHILKRPDSYIGSVETITQQMWTYDSDTKRLVHRDVKYVPGFFKIVDEILVNAADNKTNDASMDTIKVNINIEDSTISVYNNGRGIPIEMHSKEKMYIPELIFGHLLSSSNYDDDEKKLTGGRNGYGAKLANIYSHEFTIETADKNSGQKYKQTWTDNMSRCGKPKISKNGKGEEWTRVTFKPDLARFGMDSIDPDTNSLLQKRVYDLCGTVAGVKVFLNDERLKVKGFKQYVEMYLESAAAEAAATSGGAAQSKPTLVYERIHPRWEVGFAISDGTFQHVSFANSISTSKGGTHVNYIADQLAKNLITAITKKNKGATVKPAQIKSHMWIFVNTLIENPTFDSQTKETLTLPSPKFGSRPQLPEDFLKKVLKSEIIERVLNWAKFKADQQIKKTDGSKRSRLTGLPKLSDANNAGTRTASKCTLILTEGDSAKALAIAGLGVAGRDNFGVFPLRGKLLNVREAKHDQIMKNEEIQNIKKIMGLQHNKDYADVGSLRYGRLMIMTDQDHDGSHIKGLLINFLDHFYPSLLKLPEFLVEFVTPIVRVTKGKQRKDFFTIPEYEQWLEETPDAKKWDSKYYKGLGTSKDSDARDYFSNMKKHVIPFAQVQEGDKELIDLAFSKKKADDRKEWLRGFQPGTYLDHNLEQIPYSDFINKELILFSMADNIRSIPSVADGLKPGQRKVIWSCFKRKLKKEIKVAQLVGYVSEHSAYHHGEQSLTQTIVNLAQDYVGSNNINLLLPNGQYGTRESGGKDHAAARYIFTELSPVTRAMFNPADDPLLKQQQEDNQIIEPEYYLPIIPHVLVNGAEGIGTGWSTTIPAYNPADIVANLRRLMNDEPLVPMLPWWRDFKGFIKSTAKNKYDVTGIATKLDDNTIEITELPIHKWNQACKLDLEAMIEDKGEGLIKDYKEHHDTVNVHYVVTMTPKGMAKAEEQGFVEFFKLTTKINTTNMICFDFDGKIKKYESPEEILEEFYPVRLAFYQKRKDCVAKELQDAFEKLSNQARFIQMIVDKQLFVSNRKKADIIADLRKHNFRPFPKVLAAKAAGEDEPLAEVEEEDSSGGENDYNYLLAMPIWNLTREKIEKLKQQANDKELELLTLLKKSPKDLWNTDLDHLLEETEKVDSERKNRQQSDSRGKKVKRKQAVLETRKSIGGKKRREDDSEDEFVPTKAPVKKAPSSQAQASQRALAPARTQAKGNAKTKTESDSDIELAPAKKSVLKLAAKRRSSDLADASDEDDDFIIKPPKKKAAVQSQVTDFFDDGAGPSKQPIARKVSKSMKPASPPKAKKVPPKQDLNDEDDSDVNFDEPPNPKKGLARKNKANIDEDIIDEPLPKRKKAPAKKRIDSDVEISDSPPKVKRAAGKKKEYSSDEEYNVPSPPPRQAPKRAVATRGKAKSYVEKSDEDEDDMLMYGDD